MDHTTDLAYLATCRRFGITPSVDDYREFVADVEANAPDDDLDED